MTFKSIIVHQGPDSRSIARLDCAISLAKAHSARLVGLFAKADLQNPRFWLMPPDKGLLERTRALIADYTTRSESAFKMRLDAEGIDGEWQVVDGLPAAALARSARSSDLIVISQVDRDEMLYGGGIPDEVLLGAGCPVLVVPYAGEFPEPGRRIMVAWDGSREAARAARDALPALQLAEAVYVCTVSARGGSQIMGTEIQSFLKLHGVGSELLQLGSDAESEIVDSSLTTVGDFGFQEPGQWSRTRHFELGAAAAGDVLLNAVSDNAIDLLVMGAYGHSRIHELVLGGMTRRILDEMTIPVLMSH